MINITLTNFETEVIETSMNTPVLVDFWADWCGPCQSLGPLLERLEVAYAGRFKLAKINADEEQQLSAAFGVRSLPSCFLIINGQPVDGFVGAQPEGKIRALLDKHVAPASEDESDDSNEESVQTLLETGDFDSAISLLADQLAADSQNDDLRFEYVRLLVQTGHWEEAQSALEEPLARIPKSLRFDALNMWLDALKWNQNDYDLADFEALIAANKRDFDARFNKSRLLMAQNQWEAAMDELLEIIMRDKKWNQEAPRKYFIAILELITPIKPKTQNQSTGKTAAGIELTGKSALIEDPQIELISRYRRKLSMALN